MDEWWKEHPRCACGANAVVVINEEHEEISIVCGRKCGVWTGAIHYSKDNPINSEVFADDIWKRAIKKVR